MTKCVNQLSRISCQTDRGTERTRQQQASQTTRVLVEDEKRFSHSTSHRKDRTDKLSFQTTRINCDDIEVSL